MSLNTLFKALADPTRRKIILLLQQGDLSAGEIAGHFAISKPSISRHLHLLKEASLVFDERKGQNVIYSLNTTVFQDVINWLFNAANIQEKGDKDEKNPQT